MTKKLLPLLTLAAVAAVPSTAAAAEDSNRAEAAMRKGIRDYARVVADATASQISVDAKAVRDVGARSTVTGSFRLTKGGKTVTYRLTTKARVLRISPGAIEYKLSARAVKSGTGFAASTGSFLGFFQGAGAREG